jgi:hypothetical protein
MSPGLQYLSDALLISIETLVITLKYAADGKFSAKAIVFNLCLKQHVCL